MLNPLVTLADASRHKNCCTKQRCRGCGSHVSTYNCGAALVAARPEAATEDWWIACDNANCSNAYGTWLFQSVPDWVDDSAEFY